MYYVELIVAKGLLDTFTPVTEKSTNYKNWHVELDLKICADCRSRHGQIYRIDETVASESPLCPKCRCGLYLCNQL